MGRRACRRIRSPLGRPSPASVSTGIATSFASTPRALRIARTNLLMAARTRQNRAARNAVNRTSLEVAGLSSTTPRASCSHDATELICCRGSVSADDASSPLPSALPTMGQHPDPPRAARLPRWPRDIRAPCSGPCKEARDLPTPCAHPGEPHQLLQSMHIDSPFIGAALQNGRGAEIISPFGRERRVGCRRRRRSQNPRLPLHTPRVEAATARGYTFQVTRPPPRAEPPLVRPREHEPQQRGCQPSPMCDDRQMDPFRCPRVDPFRCPGMDPFPCPRWIHWGPVTLVRQLLTSRHMKRSLAFLLVGLAISGCQAPTQRTRGDDLKADPLAMPDTIISYQSQMGRGTHHLKPHTVRQSVQAWPIRPHLRQQQGLDEGHASRGRAGKWAPVSRHAPERCFASSSPSSQKRSHCS